MSYLKQARYRIFPNIKDWTTDHNDLRTKHPNKMRWIEWFWFHPSAFKLMKYGIPIIGITHFGVAAFILLKLKIIWVMIMCIIFCIMCFVALLKAIKDLKISGDMNFYDLHLRDYEVYIK